MNLLQQPTLEGYFVHTLGPILMAKEVGPPALRWPEIHVGRWCLWIGWRQTAYWICLG